jgi:glycerophosphoryl diester phosphodiesterase
MTADSLLIISHDNELDIRTNGKGLLSQKKWKEVSKLKLKDPHGTITEYPIPTFQEAKQAHQLAPDLMLAVGFNSREHIAAVEQSGIPMSSLVALTPRELQEPSFYSKIHSLNVVASLGTNGNIDTLQTNASRPLYQKIWESGGPDIICTDNPVLVHSIFRKKE